MIRLPPLNKTNPYQHDEKNDRTTEAGREEAKSKVPKNSDDVVAFNTLTNNLNPLNGPITQCCRVTSPKWRRQFGGLTDDNGGGNGACCEGEKPPRGRRSGSSSSSSSNRSSRKRRWAEGRQGPPREERIQEGAEFAAIGSRGAAEPRFPAAAQGGGGGDEDPARRRARWSGGHEAAAAETAPSPA